MGGNVLRTATILVTAMTVLWHAVVGCHACHARGPTTSFEASAKSELCDNSLCRCTDCVRKSKCCRHEASTHKQECDKHDSPDGSAGIDSSSDHETPCLPCDGTTCSSRISKAVSFERVLWRDCSSSWLSISDVLVLGDRESSVMRFGRQLDDRAPPLRTHLALHVLLI